MSKLCSFHGVVSNLILNPQEFNLIQKPLCPFFIIFQMQKENSTINNGEVANALLKSDAYKALSIEAEVLTLPFGEEQMTIK